MNPNDTGRRPSQGSPLTIVLLALITLGILSMLPWGDLTGHKLKDFNLFSDILHSSAIEYVTEEIVDPALEAELQEAATETEEPEAVVEEPEAAIVHPIAQNVLPAGMEPGELEDYSADGSATDALRVALASGTLRAAMIGDSYIEGDILSGSIRRRLQDRIGGRGVGYVPMTSAVAGFRRTVRLSSQGFTACDIRNDRLDSLHTLPGEYFRATRGATATFRGEKNGAHTASWSRSRVVFMAPHGGTIATSTDGGASWEAHEAAASPDVQSITIDGETARLDIRCDADGMVVFGAWLDDRDGASLDCMSLRGYSGVSHRSLGISTARAMAACAGVDYDMIIVEYGMNALSSQQTEYTAYGNLMKRVLLRIKACYPGAVVIMAGVGDRGQKQGTEVASLPTVPAIIEVQRKAARDAGVIFWDMRAAMGGENAIVDWRDRGLVKADYIHLNHKGGEEMGSIFYKSLMRAVDE